MRRARSRQIHVEETASPRTLKEAGRKLLGGLGDFLPVTRDDGGQQPTAGSDTKFTIVTKIVVRPRTAEQFEKFDLALHQIAQITSAHRLAGSGDYLLEVELDRSVDFAKFRAEILERLPGYVQSTAAVVVRTVIGADARRGRTPLNGDC